MLILRKLMPPCQTFDHHARGSSLTSRQACSFHKSAGQRKNIKGLSYPLDFPVTYGEGRVDRLGRPVFCFARLTATSGETGFS